MPGVNAVEVLALSGPSERPVLQSAYSSGPVEIVSPANLALTSAKWLSDAQTSGFHAQEWWRGEPARWTNGSARLSVPSKFQRARGVEIDLLRSGLRGVELEVQVNGCQIFKQWIPPGPKVRTLDFLHCPRDSEDLEITLLSGTFVPAKIKPNSKDKRTLGIAVRSIYLLR